jgi:hypothetical protein
MLDQNLQMRYDTITGERFPHVAVTVEGVHDVGRLLACLARGNVEQASLAFDIARSLNSTPEGRYTLEYLERHGGPRIGPTHCEQCDAGNHADCYQVEDPYEYVCACFEMGVIDHGL